jgi:hypothetical protein
MTLTRLSLLLSGTDTASPSLTTVKVIGSVYPAKSMVALGLQNPMLRWK